ncbi:MAG: hypothetical protein JSR77_01535 [Planctomycetes bacterium]|nr:hypothetical protein [Planctomycetota bacterium]
MLNVQMLMIHNKVCCGLALCALSTDLPSLPSECQAIESRVEPAQSLISDCRVGFIRSIVDLIYCIETDEHNCIVAGIQLYSRQDADQISGNFPYWDRVHGLACGGVAQQHPSEFGFVKVRGDTLLLTLARSKKSLPSILHAVRQNGEVVLPSLVCVSGEDITMIIAIDTETYSCLSDDVVYLSSLIKRDRKYRLTYYFCDECCDLAHIGGELVDYAGECFAR